MMKSVLFISSLFVSISFATLNSFSQDTLYLKTGEIVPCEIQSLEGGKIFYTGIGKSYPKSILISKVERVEGKNKGIGNLSNSQGALESKDTVLTYTGVIQVSDSATKNELFKRAQHWFVVSFKDANSVIQTEDLENGEITGKGSITYSPIVFYGSDNTRGKITFVISLYFRNGRYKYVFTNFRHEGNGDYDFDLITSSDTHPVMKQNLNTRIWNDIKLTISNNIPTLIQSLKNDMAKPSPTSGSEDW